MSGALERNAYAKGTATETTKKRRKSKDIERGRASVEELLEVYDEYPSFEDDNPSISDD